MALDLFKEIMPSIMTTGRSVLLEPEDEKKYVPYIVNKALSFHVDCVMFANLMNQKHFLDKRLQYDFLLHIIRKRKRPFQKWIKKEENEDINIIKTYYGCSESKANEIYRILSVEQVKELYKRTDKGGVINGNQQ